MKIILAYKVHDEGVNDPYTSLVPVGLGSLNAVLRRSGWDCTLANFSGWSWKKVAAFLRSASPAVVGISQFTHNRIDSLRLAREAKRANPSCTVALGGPHASGSFREILAAENSVDLIVIGEGETSFPQVLESLERGGHDGLAVVPGISFRRGGEIVTTPIAPPVPDLDLLPLSGEFYDGSVGVDIHRQLEFVISSRGCPAACSFCSSPRIWGRTVRFRSPRTLVGELRELRDRFGLLTVSFRDDTFTADPERIYELCRLLMEERLFFLWSCQSRVDAVDAPLLAAMKRAGCEGVQFGVESGSPSILARLGKRTLPQQVREAARLVREAGIHLSVYLISGTPGESSEDIDATVNLVAAIRPHDGQVSPLVYYPGTPLFHRAVREGAIPTDLFDRFDDALFPVRTDADARRSQTRLFRALTGAQNGSRFTLADFGAQKRAVGYSFVTNLLTGSRHEEEGAWSRAEEEYREIVKRDDDNPWGWLALGEVAAEQGDLKRALDCFRRVIDLVPAHVPAHLAMGELCRAAGKRGEARAHYERAVELNPCSREARDGVRSLMK